MALKLCRTVSDAFGGRRGLIENLDINSPRKASLSAPTSPVMSRAQKAAVEIGKSEKLPRRKFSQRAKSANRASFRKQSPSTTSPLAVKKISAPSSLGSVFGLRVHVQKSLTLSWSRLLEKPRSGLTLIQRVLDKLCEEEKGVNDQFLKGACVRGLAGRDISNATKSAHVKHIFQVINDLIGNLEGPSTDIMEQLSTIGKNHSHLKNLGFNNKFFDQFGQKFLDILVVHDVMRKQPGALHAWTRLTACMVERLCVGFLSKS